MSVTINHKPLKNGAIYLETISSENICKSPKKISAISAGQTSKVPLAPQNVSAKVIDDVISISMTVLIDSDATINTLDVYVKKRQTIGSGVTAITRLPLYIVYDYKEEKPTFLYEYTINFNILDVKGAIDIIESYLYDRDPVTSSGTKTTVKRGLPGH